MGLTFYNKQLLDEVFVICRIINVEVRVISRVEGEVISRVEGEVISGVEGEVISRVEGEADNSYRDIDNFAYHKNRIQ